MVFSHIYIEEKAEKYPLTHFVREKFQNVSIVPVNHYKELFSRPKQNFRLQKQSPKLILAVRENNFIYPGPRIAASDNTRIFYYSTPMLNCLYDCEYCFLQGMFDSANIVLFVNQEDFFSEITKKSLDGPLYLSNSYETDLLALEGMIPITAQWLKFAKKTRDVFLEIRTKSAYKKIFSEFQAIDNVVFAWTLSPKDICKTVEHGTPSVEARLNACHYAQENSWKVRLCLDPVILSEHWISRYKEMIDQIFSTLKSEKILDISIGTLRLGESYYAKIKKMYPEGGLLQTLSQNGSGEARYDPKDEQNCYTLLQNELSSYLPSEKINIWGIT